MTKWSDSNNNVQDNKNNDNVKYKRRTFKYSNGVETIDKTLLNKNKWSKFLSNKRQ